MYYEINVSKNGQHYFATHERSLTYIEEAEAMLDHFTQLFPAAEGYELQLTCWQTSGQRIKTIEATK